MPPQSFGNLHIPPNVRCKFKIDYTKLIVDAKTIIYNEKYI